MTLIDRLTAAIDAKAAKALAAAAGPWQVANAIEIVGPGASGRTGSDDAIVSSGDSGGGVIDTPTAEHIADNDPQVVIRMCQAHRELVELHAGEHECREVHTGTYAPDWPATASYGAPGQTWRHVCTEYFDTEPCPTLRKVAAGYGLTEEDT